MVFAPFLTSSPGFGTGGGVMSMLFYRPSAGDAVSPNSSLMGVGAYSNTDSYFWGLFNQLYLDEDRWRAGAGLLGGRIRSDLTVGPLDDIKFDTEILGTFLRAQRRLGESDWFVGATAAFFAADFTSRSPAGDIYFDAFDVTDESEGSAGLVASYDSRDDQRYPGRGVLAEASLGFHPEWLGVSQS